MTADATLVRARAGDGEAFRELTDPYRRELHAHCYRILGSVQDAEDLLQETLLAAWRGLDGYEGRASLRGWLHRIAANRCLNALRDRKRRPRSTLPERAPRGPIEPTRLSEPIWLEPYPDAFSDIDALADIDDRSTAPEARYETRETLELAFVASLQHLPPRQRAVLVLRDVLGFRASEVADMLDTTEASVNSALQRARATFDGEQGAARGRDGAPLPHSPLERELAGRFADAFERGDVDDIVELLTDDVRLTMPPEPVEYRGREAVAAFLEARIDDAGSGGFRFVPTRANTQPAFGYYLRNPRTSIAHAHGLVVLTLDGDRISAITRFSDGVLPQFGLPRTLRDE